MNDQTITAYAVVAVSVVSGILGTVLHRIAYKQGRNAAVRELQWQIDRHNHARLRALAKQDQLAAKLNAAKLEVANLKAIADAAERGEL